ncbi:hypothetical protein [Absidia glauca]|uniref:Enolase-phosphatase E1 n=1 Tax=Absidia glauca TaxID=4829 RepID=A0A168RKG4_ABSGL|nr:hypothetical protein [Absidia glauca]
MSAEDAVLRLKRKGAFDELRKRLLSDFQTGSEGQDFVKQVQDFMEKRIAQDPSLLDKDRATFHTIMMDEIEKTGMYQAVEKELTNGLMQTEEFQNKVNEELSAVTVMTSPTNYNTVILDIEGTITPITFVKETLFPYVTNGLDTFLDKEWGTTDLDHYIQLLRDQAEKDVTAGLEGATLIPTKRRGCYGSSSDDIKAAVKQNIRWQMAADRKIGALKAFQGYMWKTGYENGELVGMVYDDVIPALNKWQSEGKKIYIYSSGSVPAQKLLIGYTKQGDLSKYFSGYFDTTVGLKVEKQSYLNIAKEIGVDTTSTILFVTDNINEIHAADQAGLQVVIADRPGNAPLVSVDPSYKIVTSFDLI